MALIIKAITPFDTFSDKTTKSIVINMVMTIEMIRTIIINVRITAAQTSTPIDNSQEIIKIDIKIVKKNGM